MTLCRGWRFWVRDGRLPGGQRTPCGGNVRDMFRHVRRGGEGRERRPGAGRRLEKQRRRVKVT